MIKISKFKKIWWAMTMVAILSLLGSSVTFAQTNIFHYPVKDGYATAFYEIREIHDALNKQLVSEYGYEFMRNYNRSMYAINRILDSFTLGRTNDMIFPDYFGGLFIDDYGNMVVLIVDSLKPFGYSSVISLADSFSDAAVQMVSFSYNELWDVFQVINNELLTNPDNIAIQNASEWFFDVINNTVVVRLLEYSERHIALFKENVVDSPLITFEKQQSLSVLIDFPVQSLNYLESEAMSVSPRSRTINPGMPIQGGRGSVGFRARCNMTGNIGFVTTAHNSPAVGSVLTGYGTVAQRACNTIGASFIDSTGHNVTNNVGGMVLHSRRASFSFPGHMTMLMSANRPYPRFGEVIHAGRTIRTPSRTLISTIFTSNKHVTTGDSGGIVTSGGGTIVPSDVLGIKIGSYICGTTGNTYGVVSWSSLILDWLNLSIH